MARVNIIIYFQIRHISNWKVHERLIFLFLHKNIWIFIFLVGYILQDCLDRCSGVWESQTPLHLSKQSCIYNLFFSGIFFFQPTKIWHWSFQFFLFLWLYGYPGEALLTSTQNVCFYGEIWKTLSGYLLSSGAMIIILKYSNTVNPCLIHPKIWTRSYGPRQAKTCLQTCLKCGDSDHPAHLELCSLFIQSLISNDSVSGQWRLWSDCTDAQSNQGLLCPHMPGDTFSHAKYHTGLYSPFIDGVVSIYSVSRQRRRWSDWLPFFAWHGIWLPVQMYKKCWHMGTLICVLCV